MPLRKCISCGKVLNRECMIKIMQNHSTKEIIINPDSRSFGRSSYVCYNKECIQESLKKKKIQRTLKTKIPEKIIENLQTIGNK